jgi:hypothetical protein
MKGKEMNNFNDENESVRDTLNRVMIDMGYFSNPVTINTPVGSRTFYEPEKSPIVKSIEERNDDVIHNHFVMPKSNWNNVVMGAITGFGEGVNRGLERLTNNLTVGLYGDHVAGYEERQNKMKQRAEQTGLGNAYKWATRAIDYRW